jgi:hypothetical protein
MKWEYQVVNLSKSAKCIDLIEAMNKLGKAGWRLVFCHFEENTFIFERMTSDIPFVEFERHNQALEGYFGGKVG